VRRGARIACAAAAAVAVVAPAAATGAAEAERERWDTRVLALIPTPGYPALPHVAGGRVYEGTYDNPRGDAVPSRVLEYSGEGTLLRSWTIRGQDLSRPHGVQVTATDSRGRLVLLDKSPPRALLLDRRNGAQTEYATFADLPLCSGAPAGAECSPAGRDQPPMPNIGEWGPDGSLYVTDYQQAVVWRVPPGGGRAVVWLADPRLDGIMFGTTGIQLLADRRTLLVAQASSGLSDADPTTGALYAVEIGPDGEPGELRAIWESRFGDLPDGIALARSGRIYVALVGLAAQIVVLEPDGRELERFPEQPLTGENGSAVPFDSPSGLAFLGTRLIVSNQSYVAGDPAHQALLDVETREEGAPEFVPARAGLAPREAAGRSRRCTRRRSARGRRGRGAPRARACPAPRRGRAPSGR
jgi:sugar lactone lactonase YvrE